MAHPEEGRRGRRNLDPVPMPRVGSAPRCSGSGCASGSRVALSFGARCRPDESPGRQGVSILVHRASFARVPPLVCGRTASLVPPSAPRPLPIRSFDRSHVANVPGHRKHTAGGGFMSCRRTWVARPDVRDLVVRRDRELLSPRPPPVDLLNPSDALLFRYWYRTRRAIRRINRSNRPWHTEAVYRRLGPPLWWSRRLPRPWFAPPSQRTTGASLRAATILVAATMAHYALDAVTRKP